MTWKRIGLTLAAAGVSGFAVAWLLVGFYDEETVGTQARAAHRVKGAK